MCVISPLLAVNMNIALDYDQTYTADPAFWEKFIDLAREHGHKVWVFTCRRDTYENREIVAVPSCLTFFTNLGSKKDFAEKAGMKVDVWIDDDPSCILYGK